MTDYSHLTTLTRRERELLAFVALGLPYKVIAARMGITLLTAKAHAGSLYAKLGAGNRTEAINEARAQGLLVEAPGLGAIAAAILQLLKVEPAAWQELVDAGYAPGETP